MPRMISRKSVLLFAVASFAVIAFACGGGDDEPAATSTSPPNPTATTVQATATSSALTGDAARGEGLFVSETCAGCHSTGDNTIVGPGLKGVRARAAALGGDAYLTESITDRNAVIVDGFNPIMSDFSFLDDQTVADLVAYLNTLN